MLSFFKQKTAYEMRIRDWSSDVCSSDLVDILAAEGRCRNAVGHGGLQGGAVAGNHRLALEAVEEIGRRHVKDGGELVEPAGTDAVGALFVFLDLLEGQADNLAEFVLTHSNQGATQFQPVADMNIDRVLGPWDNLCNY